MVALRQCEYPDCPNTATKIVAVDTYKFVACCDAHVVEGTVVYPETKSAAV